MHPQTNAIGDPGSYMRLNPYSVAPSLNDFNTVIVVNAQLKQIYSTRTNYLYTPLTRYKLEQVFTTNEGWHMFAAAAALQGP